MRGGWGRMENAGGRPSNKHHIPESSNKRIPIRQAVSATGVSHTIICSCHVLRCAFPRLSPEISKSLLQMAVSPMLWARHKPDRFDMWSLGIIMLQIAVPTMRYDRGLKQFNSSYANR